MTSQLSAYDLARQLETIAKNNAVLASLSLDKHQGFKTRAFNLPHDRQRPTSA